MGRFKDNPYYKSQDLEANAYSFGSPNTPSLLSALLGLFSAICLQGGKWATTCRVGMFPHSYAGL